MRIAMYVRVSTQTQVQAQTIEEQLARLQTHCQSQGWTWNEDSLFRDDGYSGAYLSRPGLDRLRGEGTGVERAGANSVRRIGVGCSWWPNSSRRFQTH